jgi:hypothetical protein
MKVSSTLLKAMLISATIGATAMGCKPILESGDRENRTLPAENDGLIDKVKDLFSPSPRNGGDPCPACGMG